MNESRDDLDERRAIPEPVARAGGVALGEANRIRGFWLGTIDYAAALELQEELLGLHATNGDLLLLLEHPAVFTTGRGGQAANLPEPPAATEAGVPADPAAQPVPIFRVGRGGDATYHGPGQLVAYPIVDLRRRGGDVREFLRALERGVIAVLRAKGVAASARDGLTGVWVGERKIASIGIGIRRGITMHGIALNLVMDLTPFERIVPCGLAGVQMTSAALELPTAQAGTSSLERVAALSPRRAAGDLFRALAREIAAPRRRRRPPPGPIIEAHQPGGEDR